MGICLILRRVFEMKREGFVRSKDLRALYEFVRRSTSVALSESAAGVLGKITARKYQWMYTTMIESYEPPSRNR